MKIGGERNATYRALVLHKLGDAFSSRSLHGQRQSRALHPEYPSGSASFCGAHAQASRRFLDSDNLGWSIPIPKGSSIVEPGVTPATDIVLNFDTWTKFEQDCGMSRLWGGVHFRASIQAGQAIGRVIGALAYEFVQDHIQGTERRNN